MNSQLFSRCNSSDGDFDYGAALSKETEERLLDDRLVGRSWIRFSSNARWKYGNGVKGMPGSIHAPNPGSLINGKRKKI